MNRYEGSLAGKGMKIAIIVSKFNETITSMLLRGSLKGLSQCGVEEKMIHIAHVPGACEIALVAKRMAKTSLFDALICIGCVIRGETAHFDYVAQNSSSTIHQIALDHNLPSIFGVLTLENIEQGLQRSGTTHGNLGYTWALNAVEMVSLLRQLPLSNEKA